jgi:hypothetical protein
MQAYSMHLCMVHNGSWLYHTCRNIQGDQKVSVHLMITIQNVTSNVQSVPRQYLAQSDCLAADRQDQGDTRLTLTPSVIPNSNYVSMVCD